MKRVVFALLAIAGAVVLASPGSAIAAPKLPSHPAPAGATVRYDFTADAALNDITYYGRDGKLVTRTNVRFLPAPISFGALPKYNYTVTFRASKSQKAGSRLDAHGAYAHCQLQVKGRTVAAITNPSSGVAKC
ncbi:hypothetical protein [Gordonia sp. NPDC003585]|uniref:hypothetical protein n=1 Tax=Gordonia sp. NPDC003585 TaxID=3154275 RepID=UPI0033AA0B9D